MDDLFDMLENDDKPLEATIVAKEDKVKTENLWEKVDFKPIKIDASKLHSTKKSFAIAHSNNNIPASVYEKILEIAKVLITKGYTFRHNGSSNDTLQNEILGITDIKVDSYIAWKKFNPDIKNPVMTEPTLTGYGIAVYSHKVFYKLPSSVRAMISMQVHTLLGKNCDDPVSMLIGYSECGTEALQKDTDYKKTGNLTFPLKICGDSNIPVYNVQNETAIKRLAENIKSHS